jgi:hypothetical protein
MLPFDSHGLSGRNNPALCNHRQRSDLFQAIPLGRTRRCPVHLVDVVINRQAMTP